MGQKKILAYVICAIILVGVGAIWVHYGSKASREEDMAITDDSASNVEKSTVDKVVEKAKVEKYNSMDALQEVIYPVTYEFDSDDYLGIANKNPVKYDFYKKLNEFSYETAVQVLSKNKGNVNYSPLSLYYALALVATGAEGDALDELLDLLGISDKDELSKQCGNFYRRMYMDNEVGKLKIANSLWMDKSIGWRSEFIKNATENFYASSFSVDFSKEETAQAMAKWIYDNTNGTLIPNIETDAEQLLSIINTVYFYDEWQDKFSESDTKSDIFYMSNGNKVNFEFMNRIDSSRGFSKGDNYTRASLGLKNGGGMVFILPDEGVLVSELISDTEKLKSAFNDGESCYGKVTWKIPKLNMDSKLDINETLESLGVKTIFNLDADFTGITDQTLFVSEIKQETHININENGVEASAYTQIMYVGAAIPKDEAEMILNRPFIYGIIVNDTLLFVGVCENPLD